MTSGGPWSYGRYVLGCGTFGGIGGSPELIGLGLDETAAGVALDEAVGLGIAVFDTAERYAGGASESMMGTWLASRGRSVADRVRISTKVAPPWVDGIRGRFDLAYIDGKLSGSLDRLGVDRVEFLLLHAPDPDTPVEETLEALEAVRASGRCARVGACNLDTDDLVRALEATQRLGIGGFDVVQNSYSLLTVDDQADVRSICRTEGLAFTPYSPLAGGVLTGKYERDAPPDPGSRLALRPEMAGDLTETAQDAIDKLRARAVGGHGVECGALALAWLAHHPDVTASVVGPSRHGPHLSLARQALEVELTATEFHEIGDWFSRA